MSRLILCSLAVAVGIIVGVKSEYSIIGWIVGIVLFILFFAGGLGVLVVAAIAGIIGGIIGAVSGVSIIGWIVGILLFLILLLLYFISDIFEGLKQEAYDRQDYRDMMRDIAADERMDRYLDRMEEISDKDKPDVFIDNRSVHFHNYDTDDRPRDKNGRFISSKKRKNKNEK